MRLVSIVIPLFNEEENVEQLYRELVQMAHSSGLYCEFVFVDDGSTDRTVPILAKAAEGDPRVRLVMLRRNFGQTAGLAAGFDHAQGEIVVALDGDLQNDPAEIPKMIVKLDEGYDIVAGWRKNRQDRVLTRKIPSMLANRLISKTTNVRLHDYGCTLKAFGAGVKKNILL
jgi:glycosyltransferase involved in cell wall biosynthesis